MNRALKSFLSKSANTELQKLRESIAPRFQLYGARERWNNYIKENNPFFKPDSLLGDVPTWALGGAAGTFGGGLIGYGLNKWRRNRELEKLMDSGKSREEAEILAETNPLIGAGTGALLGGVGLGVGLPYAYLDDPKKILALAPEVSPQLYRQFESASEDSLKNYANFEKKHGLESWKSPNMPERATMPDLN